MKILILLTFIALSFHFIINSNLKFLIKSKNQIQNIHEEKTLRLGGMIILFWLVISYLSGFLENFNFYYFFALLFLIPAFFEDLHIHTNPKIRFLCIIIACFFILLFEEKLPIFNTYYFDDILNNLYFKIIFFTFSLATVINGMNMIDGTNGLCVFTTVSIFISLILITLMDGNHQLMVELMIITSILLVFLFFNYPFGRIFLGDTGSYLLGFLSGIYVIKIYAEYPDLSTWGAATILFYPAFEVLFSFIRKIYQKKSPFNPDNQHLHIKVFYILNKREDRSTFANSLVAPVLSIFWLSPLGLFYLSNYYSILNLIFFIFFIFSYIFIYWLVNKL